MAAKRQTRQNRWTRQLATLLAGGSMGLGMTIMTGCSHTPTTAPQNADPLTGVRTPPGTPGAPPNVPAAPSAPPQSQTNSEGLPPIPTALSAPNTATIAGTSWQAPGSLAINDKAPIRLGTPGQLTNDPKTTQTPVTPGFPLPANPKPRVEQIPDAKSSGQTITPTGSWQAPPDLAPAVQTVRAGPVASADTLAKQLQDRGVIHQIQETVPEGIKLTCDVPRVADNKVDHYVAFAADYAAAVQLMLDQLPAPPR